MNQLQYTDTTQAIELIEKGAMVADIRDPQSFASCRIKGSYNLNNDNVDQFLNSVDFDTPILVCCYHGISSQSAGQFLIERGFDQVYSINGGFEAWQREQPDFCES